MSNSEVVLITGASTGFGRLITETLARKGYRVFATMREVNGRNARAKLHPGEDPGRKDAYGDAAKLPDMVSAILKKSQANPQEIADKVLQIIETPPGTRQLRYRVGANDLGVSRINALTDEVQAQLLAAFGVTDMTRFKHR